MAHLDYSILGPLSVRAQPDGPPVVLAEKPMLLLARLLAAPGRAIASGTLVQDVWGDQAPELKDSANSLQRVVAQLRQHLGDNVEPRRVIVLAGTSSYRLLADPVMIDAERFKLLARRGHALLEEHPRAARAMLEESIASWHGPPFSDLGDRPWIAAYAAELEAVRDAAEVDLNELLLFEGEHARLESLLRRQIAADDTDERRWAQLIRLLEAMGREAEASVTYRDAVKVLGTPGAELSRLAARIARGGRAEEPPGPSRAGPTGRSDRVLLHGVLDGRGRKSGQPGVGLAVLIVALHDGEPYVDQRERVVAAFDGAEAAVVAAKALAGNAHLRCAVGLHTGASVQLRDRLTGPAPGRCRLLGESARHGQVLVSAAARDRYLAAARLRDLGMQRYTDLLPGESVFELWADARYDAALAPETLNTRPHNLPVLETRFVGRAHELAVLSRSVAAGELITLLGDGGFGKTRLALQAAARAISHFDDGVWFARLAELPAGAGAEVIAATIVGQLGIRTVVDESALESLVQHLSDRSALLIVDNCEHVLDGCTRVVSTLRARCRQICIVATSRHPLRLDGERVVEVRAMGTASMADALPDAVELLLERASPILDAATRTDDLTRSATRICEALDGSPLGIELAAGQIANRGLAGVAVEVDAMLAGKRGLHALRSRDPSRAPRQRDLEATTRWSHDLMGPSEQRVLRRLAVFSGSFGVAQAQVVAADDRLSTSAVADAVGRLVDWSMVALEPPVDGTARLSLKQAIRAFALARLEDSGEMERTRRRHADVYRAHAVAVAPTFFGPGEQTALEALDADHDNLRSALSQLVKAGRSEDALELTGALWWLWFSRGHFREGSEWVERVLALDDAPSLARVRVLRVGSHLTWWGGNYAQTDAYNRAIEECAEAIGDDWGLAWAPMAHGAVLVFGDPERALPLFRTSRRLFQDIGREWEAAYALQLTAVGLFFVGREEDSLRAYEEAERIYERIGHGSVLASVRRGAGMLAARRGQIERGRTLCREALVFSESIGDRQGSAQALNFLASIGREEGRLDIAADRYAAALSLAREVGDLWATCSALDGISGVACASGEYELAVRLLACSSVRAARAGYDRPPHERARHDADGTRLRDELSESEFERASAEGGLMSVADALASALAFVDRLGTQAPV